MSNILATDTLMNISVIGAGSYGTALAVCLARNGHQTLLWGRDQAHVAKMCDSRSNEKYLPGSQFPPSLALSDDLAATVQASDNILIVVPSHAFGDMLKQIQPHLRDTAKVAWATKGLDPDSGSFITGCCSSCFR